MEDLRRGYNDMKKVRLRGRHTGMAYKGGGMDVALSEDGCAVPTMQAGAV